MEVPCGHLTASVSLSRVISIIAVNRSECHAVLIPGYGGSEKVAYEAKERGCQIDDWSPDGRFITFHRDPSLMALPMTSEPKPWPFVQTPNANRNDQYAVSSDGQRFLLQREVLVRGRLPLTVVLNWDAEVN